MASPNDVSRLQYVLDNYDTISESGTTGAYWEPNPSYPGKQRQAQTVVFGKKVNGTYYVVEAVPESAYKKFWVVSAYLQKADGGTQAPNANGPGNTPNASLASSPSVGPTVAQTAQGVKNQDTRPGRGYSCPGAGLTGRKQRGMMDKRRLV